MLKLVTLEEFIDEINKIVFEEDCTIANAICQYAEMYDINYEALIPYINKSFINVLKEEAESMNLIKKDDGQLPF
jgi:hypothetical protein